MSRHPVNDGQVIVGASIIPLTPDNSPHVLTVKNTGPGLVTVDWHLGAGPGMVTSYAGAVTLAAGEVRHLAVAEPYGYGELVITNNSGAVLAVLDIARR